MKNTETFYPLSPMQQGILFHALYTPGSDIYFQQMIYTLRGELNPPDFVGAWRRAVGRHPVLRTGFIWDDLKEPVQVVRQRVELPFRQEDLRGLAPAEQQEWLENFLRADRERGFDLAAAPLVRCALMRTADDGYEFVLSYHHLLLDGWSLPLLLKEVLDFYDAAARNLEFDPPPSRPYGDYIAWLRRADFSRAEQVWREALAGIAEPTPLGAARTPDGKTVGAQSHGEQQVKLSPAETEALQTLARQNQLTLNTVIQGAWAVLLGCYSREEDVLFGTVVSGRPAELPGAETMIGLFTNVLPVRARVSRAARVAEWLRDLQARQAELRQYEYTPLWQAQEWSEVPRGLPLFNSILVFENYPADASLRERRAGLGVEKIQVAERTHYPLNVTAVPGPELLLRITYDDSWFDADAAGRMLGHFKVVLAGMAADPAARVGDLPVLTEIERYLLERWNATEKGPPADRCIHQLFEEQAAKSPDAVAVVDAAGSLSYGELNARADRLARRLRAAGVGPEVPVGVCLRRSTRTVVALLAIYKAGGAYVPLDPAYPAAHLAYILRDTNVPVLITERGLAERLPAHSAAAILFDAEGETGTAGPDVKERESGVTIENLAYVMYTSGSTGQPKGVAVEQKQLLNRFAWMWDAYPFGDDEVACQRTTVSFSVSMWEWLGPLLRGVPTVIVPDEAGTDPHLLVRTLAAHGVTRVVLVPSLLRAILDAGVDLKTALPRLKMWSTCGEPLSAELCRRFYEQLPDALLVNQYGASEVNDSCWYEAGPGKDDLSGVPIGRPISNLKVYLLGRGMRPTPVGFPGELHVSSVSPARGYLNKPGLTAEKFVPDPFGERPGARLYNMGDLARFMPDGNLEYLGRSDFQIKIRGQRVEPQGVEATLARHPSIREAAVVVRESAHGDRGLVAYVVPKGDPAPDAAELSAFVCETLPSYMTPAVFVTLDALPRTPNGKLDRKALPAVGDGRLGLSADYAAPRDEAERVIAETWAALLGVERVGVRDNFFELGGHSLNATRIASRLGKAFQIELPLRHLFEHPTVAELAREVSRLRREREEKDEAQLVAMLGQLSDEEVEAELRRKGGGS